MAEIAVLVEAVFGDKSPADLHRRVRSDSSLKLGFEKLYLILKSSVEVDLNGKLGFELWDQSQIQAVSSIGNAIYSEINSVHGMVSVFVKLCDYVCIGSESSCDVCV